MDWWQAFILGIVEGLTEYLPVSSTGHLILAQRAMGIEQSPQADAYVVCIQVGAILAVAGLYWPRMVQMARGLLGRDTQGLRLALNILAAFVPAAVFGLLFDDKIEEHLFGLWPIVIAWAVGGALILLTALWKRRQAGDHTATDSNDPGRDLHALTWQTALVIGLIQCVAMWPGTSRSLVTIVGGLVVGLRIGAAVEFSFLLGLVTLTAATGYKLLDAHEALLESYSLSSMAIGVIAAAVSAAIAVNWMVGYLKRHGLSLFGWYRLALGAVVAALILAGVLAA